jgi:hypothetical protein
MKTKSLLAFLFVGLLIGNATAQNFKLAAQFGANGTSVSSTVSEELKQETFAFFKTRFGLRLGVLAEYNFKDNMALQSGVFYTQKGYWKNLNDIEKYVKEEEGDDIELSGKWGNRYNYLEMPIHFVYKMNDFQFFAGPYFAYGIGGKSKIDLTVKEDGETDSLQAEADIEAVSGNVEDEDFFDLNVFEFVVYKNFDYGLDLGVGYTYDKFLIQMQYSLGMTNIIPQINGSTLDVDKDYNLKNRGFSLSVSYFFK